jgi:hypothetical protein
VHEQSILVDAKHPVDLGPLGIASMRPGGDLSGEFADVGNAAVEASGNQDANLDLGHVDLHAVGHAEG